MAADPAQQLLAWYGRNRRDLPWRRTKDPYRIWVSEVMLQQTTVKTVLPYYAAFVERYPSLAALAAASEEEVLALWSGLGYYHRARNLRRAAQYLVAEVAGRFPRSLECALAVPGVGLYTASAVLSIAYGLPLPVVDGNVRRVFSRWFALRGARWRKDGAFYEKADEILDRQRPGEWNQAVMELGATVCLPREPKCPVCPLRQACRALALKIVESLPEGKPRRLPQDVTVATAVVERAGRFLLVRRPEGRLLGRMWEIPQTSLASKGYPDLVSEVRERDGLEIEASDLLARARHAITFRRIRVEAYRARLTRRPPRDPDRIRWVTPEEAATLPMSSLTKKVLRALRSPQLPLAL